MSKDKLKEKSIRVLILFIGLVIAHFGVTLFLLAELGADPFNVFIQGLFRTVQKISKSPLITHGRVHMAVSILIVIVLLFVDKSYIKIGTAICMFFGGPIIDWFTALLSPVFASGFSLPARIIVNCLGCIILAFGMTLVIKSEAGTGPNDLVAVVISDKLHKKFSIIRVIVDVLFAGIGFILGGTIGLGTVICAFLVGPAAGFFMPFSEKIVKRFV